MKKTFFISLVFLSVVALKSFAQDVETTKRTKQFNIEKNGGIKGYDPVTYFTQSKAVKGKEEFAFSFSGINYLFSSKATLDLFKVNPSKYEPQYGGWCSYAMGNDGSKVEIDPETFKIVDGKLYLFYNFYFTNTLKKWNADETVLKKNADANWNKITTSQ